MEYIKLKKVANYPTGKLNSNAACENGSYPFFTCSHEIFRIDSYAYDGEFVLLGGNNATGDFPIFYYNGKFEAYQRTYLIQPKDKEKYSTRYLYYAIGEKLSLMQKNASGTATKFLTKPIIDNITIPFFPIDKQKTIVSILSAYDNLIENNNRRIRLLEQMAENLYKEWFVRFRFPGHEKAEFENGLPKGWKVDKMLKEYVTSSGGTPSRNNPDYYSGDIPWIKTGELLGSFILNTEEHITEEAIKNSSAKLIPPYSLLIAMYAGANVGNLGINTMPATCNQACCVIRSKGSYSLYYLMFFLQTQKSFLQSISFGAAQQNISQEIIKELKVLYPPIIICKQFDAILLPQLKYMESLMRQNEQLITQRDLFLPRLMSGKLEVKV